MLSYPKSTVFLFTEKGIFILTGISPPHLLFQLVNDESRTQLRFEPRRLGRHDVARVGNIHQLLHADRIEGQSHLHLTTVHTLLQLAQPADTAHEVDALVRTEVLDTEYLVQNEVGGDSNIEYADGIIVVIGARLGRQAIPLAVQVEGEIVQARRFIDVCTFFFNDEVLAHRFEELRRRPFRSFTTRL